MDLAYLERRNGLRGDSAAPEFSGRSEDDHHQHLPIVAPEVQPDLALVNYRQTFPSDDRKSRSCQSCHRSPCSCGGGDAACPELCPTLPAKMMILEFLIRSLRHPTRTHNVSDLDDLISGGASAGDVTLGPSDKMMLESLHALVNAKTRAPKSPSFFLPGAKMRKTRSRPHTITQSEILKLISPETWEMSSPGASSPSKRSTAEPDAHEGTVPSCSGTACLRPSQPGLSSYPPPSSSLSAGLLQCIWKDGLPHFELSLDNPMAMYTASPVKPHDSSKAAAADYIYLFHSDEQGKKDWMGNYSSSVSKLVGKMKVSSSLVLGSDGSRCVETEFVMYGSPDDYLRQMQSTYSAAKGKGLVKRVAEIMRSPNASSSPKHGAWGRFGRPSSPLRFDDDVREMLDADPGGAGKAAGLVSLAADDLPTNQEAAAIVVRERREEPAVGGGGWGLKFLEKAGGAADSESRSEKARWCISAIVPRGYHGGVAPGTGGPSGLVERWRNGGRCECGGWDLGCPIRVLSNDGGGPSPQPQDNKSVTVELSLTGARSGDEPAVRLVSVAEGLYILYFDAGVVSPLQCFAAGVAVVHSQAPQLRPKL